MLDNFFWFIHWVEGNPHVAFDQASQNKAEKDCLEDFVC